MLAPDQRTVLTDALRPPPGATLERAVALTFTLSMESALVVPLAFAASGFGGAGDELAVLEAVRACADRVDVFCQAGAITVPARGADLLAFVEPMIHPVAAPRWGRLFHPKLWALTYRDEEGAGLARLLVLSRNLTPDRAWDVCLRLDGVVGTRPRASNRPLVEVVRRARELVVAPLPRSREEGLDRLLEDLRRADWELPEDVREVVFHALGVGRSAAGPDFTGSRHLVVSPFVTAEGMTRTAPERGAVVVGRQEELDLLPETALDGAATYVVSELAGLGAEDGEPGASLLTGLHAKLYVVEKGHTARVLLGSANATGAAFGGNVEFLAELVGSRTRLGIDTMMAADARFRSILEPYRRRPPEEVDDAQRRLEDVVRAVAAAPLTGSVEPVGADYVLHLGSDDPLSVVPDGVRLTAELLTRRGEAADLVPTIPVAARFGPLEIVHITPFVVLTATDEQGLHAATVVHARLVGDPAGRLDEILARQVDTPEKFLRFLSLLLGIGSTDEPAEGDPTPGPGGRWAMGSGTGVFELLMKALVDHPARLEDLARLVSRLESTERRRALLPDGFAELWAVLDRVRREPA